MTTLDFNQGLPNLGEVHDQYPYLIIPYYLDSYTPEPTRQDSYTLEQVPDEDGDDQNAYRIENREQLYHLIADIAGKIHDELTDRFDKGLGSPHDDETSDIQNAIDLLNTLSELDFI